MRRAILASFAALALTGLPAVAADMSYKAAPVVSTAYNWTGFYIGVNGGYGWAKQGVASGDGAFGGGQIGYNWQAGAIVLGVEADIQGGNLEGSNTFTGGGVTITETQKMDYFGTVRGRLGLAMGRWMPYVTGGLAYTSVKHDGVGVAGIAGTYSATNELTGYAIGGGVEAAVWDRWTARVEYLHMSFGSTTNTYTTTVPAIAVTYSRLNTDLVRLGLNYRF